MKHLSSAEDVKKGERIVVTIKRLGINGEGVGYFRRKAVFVDGALPDEVVKVEVTDAAANFLSGRLIKVEKKSKHRVAPPCPVYEACGGCQLQHSDYAGQLYGKVELVRESFARYVGESSVSAILPVILPVIGMDEPWRYRNKSQFRFALDEHGKVITGLYGRNSHDLIAIEDCLVQPQTMNRLLNSVREIVQEQAIPVYDETHDRGVLRSLVVRTDFDANGNERFQLTFVTATDGIPRVKELIAAICKQHPNVAGIAQNVNFERTSLVFGEQTRVLWGAETLQVALRDLQFSLSPTAFFQLNPTQTIRLYDEVLRAADLQGNELVVDAYCGTGTIGLWLARHVLEVRGIETSVEAVKNARANARQNEIDNAEFHVGKTEELLPKWIASGLVPDVIVVDPPRTGCDRKLLQTFVRLRFKKIVYVSCNPATLAKDCRVLIDGGYVIESVQPVDMFPQTSHVECVVVLVRK